VGSSGAEDVGGLAHLMMGSPAGAVSSRQSQRIMRQVCAFAGGLVQQVPWVLRCL
jgi:hypothetical protein